MTVDFRTLKEKIGSKINEAITSLNPHFKVFKFPPSLINRQVTRLNMVDCPEVDASLHHLKVHGLIIRVGSHPERLSSFLRISLVRQEAPFNVVKTFDVERGEYLSDETKVGDEEWKTLKIKAMQTNFKE